MPDDVYSYDFGAMTAASDDIAAALLDLDRIRGEATALVTQLHDVWPSGAAAESWHAYSAFWATVQADVNDELAELRRAVDHSHHLAHSAEAANHQLWNV